MNKTELISAVAEKTGMTKKDSDKVIAAALEVVTAALAGGEKVQFVGFGGFEVKDHAARTARNPKTGETVMVPASKTVQFKAGKELKNLVK